MTCASPNAPCGCCRDGKPCAYILQLTPAQWTQIARVESLIGTAQSWVRSTPMRTTEQRKAAEAEPMTRVECPVCEREFEMFTYLVEFLEQQHAPFPRCEDCVDRVKREAKRAA